jgi:nicotinamidase-related amidase
MPDSRYTGVANLLAPENCTLLLIDHQPSQLASVQSMDRTLLVSNVVGLAKTAKVFGVPTVLSTVLEDRGGFLFKDVQGVFPEQKTINRTTLNAWEDPRVVAAIKKTGRKKLVVEAHDRAVQRMVQAGATPLTWIGFACELQRDWAREKTIAGVADIMNTHGGTVGANIAWEFQLLK